MTAPAPLPPPPSVAALQNLGIRQNETHTVASTDTWWRVHNTQGKHVLPWNSFRHHGPVARFDPHPLAAGGSPNHPGHGVWYAAADGVTALGEVFQGGRTIDRRRGAPHLTALRFQHPLTLLDLSPSGTGRWPVRAGANYALATAPHVLTQQWANRITAAFPNLHGVYYRGLNSGGGCMALFLPARPAMPRSPVLSRPLSDPALQNMLAAAAAAQLGYQLV